MKPSLQTATLVVLALLTLRGAAQQLVQDRDYYCNSVTLDNYTMSPQELKWHRDNTYTDFYTDYNQLFNFIISPDSNSFIRLYKYQFGLLMTLELLILLSLIFFIITLCVRIRCRCNWWWECLWLFVLFFLIFVGLFIAHLVFIGVSQANTSKAYCVIHSMPAALLYGNPGTPSHQEFIGFQPLSNLLGNYTLEVVNLNRVQSNAQGIVTANLPVRTKSLINAQISNWANQFTNRVAGPTGPVIPDTVIRAPAGGPFNIEKEFATLDGLANGLYTTASQVQFLGGSWFASDSVTALNTMQAQVKSSFETYRSASDRATSKAMLIQSYGLGAFWTFFGLSIVIIIIGIIIIIAFCEARRGRCLGCVRAMKWILILLAFLVFVYGILVLILMAGVAGLSPLCKFLAELNQGGWNAANTFENLVNQNSQNGSALNDTNPGSLLKYCAYKNSTGDIPSLFNSTSYVSNNFNRLISIVNGLTLYRNYIRTYNGFTQTSSPAIATYTGYLGNLTAGDLYDNTAVYLANAELNRLVACSNNQYAYTANGCRNYLWSSCSGIGPNGFTVPSCSSNQAQASAYYNNIKAAVASEAAVVASITSGLAPVNTQYGTVITAFAAQQANIQAIQGALANTLNTISAYNNTLSQIVNCNTLQTEMVQLERYLCFPFVKPMYVLLVLACIALFFLFVLLWVLWSILVSRDESVDTVVVVRKEEFLAVSEQELVPKY